MADPCAKTTYSTEKVARRQARQISEGSGEDFRAYLCPDCRRWHLTTSTDGTTAPRGRRGGFQKHWPVRVHTLSEMEAVAKAMRERRVALDGGEGSG